MAPSEPEQMELFDPVDEVQSFRGLPIIANQAKAEKAMGESLSADVFELAPWGSRLVVVSEKPVEQVGRIVIPEGCRDIPTVGYVLSVGPMVAEPNYQSTLQSWCPFPRERLLGCRVIYGMYSGEVLQTGEKLEDAFRGRYKILNQTDVWGTVGEPPTTSWL